MIAPRDFEVLAITRLFKARSEIWLPESPLDGKYPIFRFVSGKPEISVAVCSTDDRTGFEHARRSIEAICGVKDARFNPTAFFLCGTTGVAKHLREKDGARIGDIVLARSVLGLSTATIGSTPKVRGICGGWSFEDSLVGRIYLQIADQWSRDIAAVLGLKRPCAIHRTDVASAPVMITDETLMSGLANAPGTESCEMELSAVAQVLTDRFGGINREGSPSLQLVKAISDFVGLGHKDKDRRIAADASAAAVISLLEHPITRAALPDSSETPTCYKANRVLVQELLERVAGSVQGGPAASSEDWEWLRKYARLDSNILEEVLEAVDYACTDACSGCGAQMDLVRPVVEGAASIIETYHDVIPDLVPRAAKVIQLGAALDISPIAQWARRMAPIILDYEPNEREVGSYRDLVLALIYVVADDFEIADRLAQRSIRLIREYRPDDEYAALRMERCRICVLARHCNPETLQLTDALLESVDKIKLPTREDIAFRLGAELRLFEYRMNVWRREAQIHTTKRGHRSSETSRGRLLEGAQSLRRRMDDAGWEQGIWRAGILADIAELSGNPVDRNEADMACRRVLHRTTQKRHCLFRLEAWAANLRNDRTGLLD